MSHVFLTGNKDEYISVMSIKDKLSLCYFFRYEVSADNRDMSSLYTDEMWHVSGQMRCEAFVDR